MCSYCDKFLCKTRPFGIGGEITFPILSDLQKNFTRYSLIIMSTLMEKGLELEKAVNLFYDQRLISNSGPRTN